MKTEDIILLANKGFTKEEILKMEKEEAKAATATPYSDRLDLLLDKLEAIIVAKETPKQEEPKAATATPSNDRLDLLLDRLEAFIVAKETPKQEEPKKEEPVKQVDVDYNKEAEKKLDERLEKLAQLISAGNVSKDIELPKSAEDILGNTLDRLKGIEPEKEN